MKPELKKHWPGVAECFASTTFTEIITFQEGFAQAKADGTVDQFLKSNYEKDYRNVK